MEAKNIQISFHRKKFSKITCEYLGSKLDEELDKTLIANIKDLTSGIFYYGIYQQYWIPAISLFFLFLDKRWAYKCKTYFQTYFMPPKEQSSFFEFRTNIVIIGLTITLLDQDM